MVDRTGSLSQIQSCLQGSGKVCLRSPHGFLQAVTKCQVAGNGAGQGTSCPMGVGVVHPFSGKPAHPSIHAKQVIGVVYPMTAFAENRAAAGEQGRTKTEIPRRGSRAVSRDAPDARLHSGGVRADVFFAASVAGCLR